MKTSASALLPFLRSEAVGELLARLLLHPDRSWTLGELASASGTSVPTAAREVSRMVAAGLLRERRVGRTRQVAPDTSALLYGPLRQLVTLTYGPVPVLEHVLTPLAGIAEAYIYGSWAARHQGVIGPAPRDVDVLVVGTPDRDELYEVGESARRQLGREVNIRTVTPEAWHREPVTDPFLTQVRDSALVRLDVGGGHR